MQVLGRPPLASSPRGDRPVAADADLFSVITKLTLAVGGGGRPGGGGTTRRASPALCHSAKSSGKRRAAGGPGEGRQVGAHCGPPLPQRCLKKDVKTQREQATERKITLLRRLEGKMFSTNGSFCLSQIMREKSTIKSYLWGVFHPLFMH